jgi:hypothetical protein
MGMKIDWQRGSAFNFGYIEGTDYRAERMRGIDDRYGFLLSDSKKTYLFVSGCIYNTPEERDTAIKREVRNRELANHS